MTSIYEKLKAENEALISELIRIMDTKYGSIVPITRENVIVNSISVNIAGRGV